MPAIPSPANAPGASSTSTPLSISRSVLATSPIATINILEANPSDAVNPSSSSDVVQLVLVIGILIAGILLFGMLTYLAINGPKSGGPLTFLEYWIDYNVRMLSVQAVGIEAGADNRPQAAPTPPEGMPSVTTNTTPPHGASALSPESSAAPREAVSE
ncbi:uncharacterized protein PHACADRAFT_265512 [Phanerochaete carnosa HHB-10118-sp]|uniref:Uncharacterized protein n=1 Tax=Phanerochaete carnosa (strain HHB-10118-sp) TaxID=650164 RepID=K5VST4_PHACS|nr:uncharacterized protein PHACADRAFT_265512 [Phanerochaete carnosa HHB-10118-sp]EKM49805.1 hypothetical protein PHACADRAFT_265512 [Phanerochaete carnosa HHB-10118-sp]